jgi:hypothetical protein
MATDDNPERGFSLKRWSRRKLDAARVAQAPAAPAQLGELGAARASAPIPPAAQPVASSEPHAVEGRPAAAPESSALPPVESLDFDSDFTPFLQAKVGEAVKRQALKKLFQDPRFNVMDGLDVYIDDYSIADPIAPEVVRQLQHARSLFAPPKTRVNAQGFVEDVPPDDVAPPSETLASAAPQQAIASPASQQPVPSAAPQQGIPSAAPADPIPSAAPPDAIPSPAPTALTTSPGRAGAISANDEPTPTRNGAANEHPNEPSRR